MACVQLRRRRQVPIYKCKRIVHARSLWHTLQESSDNILVRGGTSAPQLNRGDVSWILTPTFEYPRARLKFQNFSEIRDARQTNYHKFSTSSIGRMYPRECRVVNLLICNYKHTLLLFQIVIDKIMDFFISILLAKQNFGF